MVVLTSLTAAIYAAILIPLKGIPIIPGITELRPAACIPLVFGVLFGPAACWGAGIGNVIGDFFGTLGIGSLFGFFGNFFYALVAYKLQPYLLEFRDTDKPLNSFTKFIKFFILAFLSSSACAIIIGWGLELVKLYPFSVVSAIISINNTLSASVLGPIIFLILYPRVRRWGLIWTEILPLDKNRVRLLSIIGFLLVVFSIIFSLLLGFVLSPVTKIALSNLGSATFNSAVALSIAPFLVLLIIGCILI